VGTGVIVGEKLGEAVGTGVIVGEKVGLAEMVGAGVFFIAFFPFLDCLPFGNGTMPFVAPLHTQKLVAKRSASLA
jgi:hypothetical protein